MFKQVDLRWKNNIFNVKKNNKVITFCANKDFSSNIMDDQYVLEKVAKNLDNYLILKRSKFARF